MTKLAQITEYAMVANNTLAWEHDGKVFVDTLNCPKATLAEIQKKFGVSGTVLHEETENEMVLAGEESTGLIFGGKATICNVIEIAI